MVATRADAAWDGTQQIVPGDRVSAVFAADPGTEVHDFSFYAPDGTRLSLQWSGPKGMALDLKVLGPDMQPIDVASHLKGHKLKGLPLTARGRHTIEVTITAGAGRYTLRTSAKYPANYGGKKLDTPASGTFSLGVGLPAGTRLSAHVKKAKGSAANPTFAGLSGPKGNVDLGGATTKLKKVALDGTGLFTLAVAGGAGDKIDLDVKAKIPVGQTDFSFDEVQTTLGVQTAIRTAWMGSAHADLTSEPFAHWNNLSPAVIPKECAKCHSGLGYQDFLGVIANPYATPPETTPSSNLNDPSPSPGQGQVASGPWPVGTPVNCDACHNPVTFSLTQVTFPSGLTATGLGDESRCMLCHQGRESTVSVDKKINDAYAANKITSDDTVSSAVGFLNVHYFSAAGSLYGRDAKTAYEYADPSKAGAGPDPVTGLLPRKAYDGKFAHVASKDVCFECHDQHSLKVRVTDCATCHVNSNGDPIVSAPPTTDAEYEAAIDNLHQVRMNGTVNDFNGNGNTTEGVYFEMTGLRDILYGAIRAYANTAKTDGSGNPVPASPIAYSPAAYPYFFVDANDNGTVDPGETTAYKAWTARLLRAAYDYQYSQKDPGAFAHNAKYLIEILYDAIEDLNSVVPVAGFANLVRNDSGHFDTSAEVYRHWDEDTDHLVDPSCARCHSPEGFLFRAKYGIDQTIPAQLSSGMTCETCHDTGTSFSPLNGNKPTRRYIKSVTFPYPSTATAAQIAAVTISQSVCSASCGNAGATCADDSGCTGCSGLAPYCVPPAEPDDSYDCMTCHQGRESTLTVDAANATRTANFTVSFRNVHYLSAGATEYGNKAAVAYEYAACSTTTTQLCLVNADCPGGETCNLSGRATRYAGPWAHTGTPVNGRDTKQCAFCHLQNGDHSFDPKIVTVCTQCHGVGVTFDTIGIPFVGQQPNYDGDGTTAAKGEVATFATRLYAAIQAYCRNAPTTPPTNGSACAYNGAAYPYWFKDANNNGTVDAGETTAMKFDSRSARAAFNYQYYQKEPGAWAHNNRYIIQILYDSIQDLGGDLTGLTRP